MIIINERSHSNRESIKTYIEAEIAYNRELLKEGEVAKYNQHFIFECSDNVLQVSPNNEYKVFAYKNPNPAIILTGDLMLAIYVGDCYNQTSLQTSNVFHEQY